MDIFKNFVSSFIPAAEPAPPAPPVEPLPISILDVDFQCYEKWFAQKTDVELVNFFTSSEVKYFEPPFIRFNNSEDKYSNWSYLSLNTLIKYDQGDKLKLFGDEPDKEYGKKVSDTDRIVHNFIKTLKIGKHSYPELKTMRGVLNYHDNLFEDRLWWMCQGKLLLLEKLHMIMVKNYYMYAGYCFEPKRGGGTKRVVTSVIQPYSRAQYIIKYSTIAKSSINEKQLIVPKDEHFAHLTDIASHLEKTFAYYLPTDEIIKGLVVAKAQKYFENNFNPSLRDPYVKYIRSEYKKLIANDDKELLGVSRIYILELIRLYPR